ncbi:GroES-like protein, partial [Atractiella rhizophila]
MGGLGAELSPDNLTIPQKNVGFVLRGVKDVEFEEMPMVQASDLADDEALVSPRKTGICGSDVHFLQHGRIAHLVVKAPMILGHETSAVVVGVGKGVKHLKAGDRVALEPGQTCRVCSDCKKGKYELCPHIAFAATPPTHGTLQGFYRLPADLC